MRPEHLHCPNTVEGIRAINEMQRNYDADPEAYEAREAARREEYQREQEEMLEQERFSHQQYLLESMSTEEITNMNSETDTDSELPF